MTCGELFKTIRQEMGLTQSDMAGILEVSQSWVSKTEKGDFHPDTKHLQTLANTVQILGHAELINEYIWTGSRFKALAKTRLSEDSAH